MLVDEVKVVAEKNGMFFKVTCAEIQELLGGAPEVWQLNIESLTVLDKWNK
jgi:hypothetical protein